MSEEDNEVIREHNGHTEHKHNGYDYWHPVHRLHIENSAEISMKEELMNAKKEHNRLLGILARTVSKKYEIQGYSTDYMFNIDGVQVVFQKVGQYDEKLYHIKYDEIEVGE